MPKRSSYVVGCKSTTKNGGVCKSSSDIEDFMKKSIFYLVGQKTFVDKSIYEDNAKDFPKEDESGYFPLRIDNE